MNSDSTELSPAQQQDQQSAAAFVAEEAHRLLAQWGDVPPEVLHAALDAIIKVRRARAEETALRLRSQHELERERIHAQKETEKAKAESATRIAQLQYRQHRVNICAGAALALALLGAGVMVVDAAPWLSTLLCGPSLVALMRIVILNRSTSADMRFLSRVASTSTNAAQSQTTQPPPTP